MNLYDKPKYQDFHIEGVKHISPEDAFELISKDEIFFIDVREESEFRRQFFNFQNVFFYPMSVIMDNLKYIPKEIDLVIVCDEGVSSVKVADLLMQQGYLSVANLDGGIKKWKELSYPIVEDGLNKIYDTNDSCNSLSCGDGCNGCNGCG